MGFMEDDDKTEVTHLTVGQRLRKGVFLLPSLITTMGFFCGFYALVAVFNGQFYTAAWAIMLAGLFDFLDGKVARLTNTTSQFGMELDSLADLMSFGIAPAFLAYMWVLQPFGRVGWMAAFLYAICGALRLARFNTMSHSGSSGNSFLGLPIPAAAGMIASLVILSKDLLDIEKVPAILMVALVYVLAFLMVSNVKYIAFKHVEFGKRKPFGILVFAILLIYIVAVIPELMLFIIGITYVSSGPVNTLYLRWKAKKEKAAAALTKQNSELKKPSA